MKKIVRLVVIVGVLLGLAILGMALFLDRGIQRAVEVVGPRLTQVEVRLERVNLSLVSGRVELEGLFVGNPEGYQSESAIEVRSMVLATRPGSWFSDKVVVHTLDLEGPVLTLEGGLQKNNLSQILDNVNAHTKRRSDPRDREKRDEPSRKLQVDELTVTGGKVQVWVNILGGRTTTIDLPEIRMTNLGTGPEGITTEELTDRLLRVIIEKATLAAAGAIARPSEDMAEELKRAGQDAVDKALNDAARGVKDLLKPRE